MAYKLTPFTEIRRAAKIDGVVFHRLPFDEQPIARRPLGRALQRQTGAALRTAKYRRGRRHTGLELGFHAGLYIDLGDFENHEAVLSGQDASGKTDSGLMGNG